MDAIVPLEHGHFYHIFNRGINGTSLFYNNDNYAYFLMLYAKYIDPVAATYAWCLMNNHFHLLVRIREVEEIIPDRFQHSVGVRDDQAVGGSVVVNEKGGIKPPHQLFSNLFNAYTQAVNRQQHRTGALFERPFHRKKIDHSRYFINLVTYIHNNPVKHGFVDNCIDYPWSSYHAVLSFKPTLLYREAVIGWFETLDNFCSIHQQINDYENILHLVCE